MAGKGDKPRNCYSKQFKNNYDKIKWSYKSESKFKDTNEQPTCNIQDLSASK